MQNSITNKFSLISAGPLLLVLFIDGMGLSLVFPVLTVLLEPQSQFLTFSLAAKFPNFIFGCVIGLFMLSWFFGAAILGDLSDQIGRKKSLSICLLGATFGYLLTAIAVPLHSLGLLLLGRIIAGLTAGSQPIAQAVMMDLSQEDQKARNIGFMLLAVSLGFILGPLIGGLLSNNQLVSWFTLATPFYFAAALSFINVFLLLLTFKETFQKKVTVNIKLRGAWQSFISAFKHIHIRDLSITFLIFMLGWSSFYSFITSYMVKNYHLTSIDISLFMALMGLGFCVGNGVLVNFFAKRIALQNGVIAFLSIGAIFTFIMIFMHRAIYLWVLVAPLACVMSIAYSMIVALFSNRVSNDAQGWVMGITGAIMALVWGLNAFVIGLLASWSIELPLLLALICFIVSPFLMYRSYKNKKDPEILLNEKLVSDR